MIDPTPYRPPVTPAAEVVARLELDFQVANARRSVRMFSDRPVHKAAIETSIRIAGTAPSGAHRQPWTFVAIDDPATKAEIKAAAEREEREFYQSRAPQEWLDALTPLGTDFHKDYLTVAPWLIIVFRRDYEVLPDGTRLKNYYMTESVGIAVGFLIQALHRAGLATLTHTPAPMTFLREICKRPANEKPFVLLPVGYPSDDCIVPGISRKPLGEIAVFNP